jgi:hypothetical protein
MLFFAVSQPTLSAHPVKGLELAINRQSPFTWKPLTRDLPAPPPQADA